MKPAISAWSKIRGFAPNVKTRRSNVEQRARIEAVHLYLAHWRAMLVAQALVNIAVMLAWRDHAPLHAMAAWCSAALLGYLFQGMVCFRIERSASPTEAMARWMPWLLGAIGVSGTLWALRLR